MRFVKSSALVALSLSGMMLLGVCHAQKTDENLAVVNGVPIPKARAEFVARMQTASGQQKDTPEFRQQLREALITREIITQEAIKKGLDKTPEFETQIALARQQALVGAYMEDYLEHHEPTEADLRAEYDKVKAEQYDPNAKEYKVRHILVKTEKEAKEVLALLAKKGTKFEDVAKKRSTDTGSKNKGGDLDWTDGSNLVPPFTEAMKALDKGQRTKTPVKTPYGFHIIEVVDVRTPQFPAFEDVKEQVAKQLISKQRDEMIDALRAAAKIE